jgi:tetratricopeptide (TPR) repeat protein
MNKLKFALFLQQGFFMRILFILLVGILSYGCGEQPAESDQSKETRQVPVVTEKQEEPEDSSLVAINRKIREDINNPDLYIERADIYKELGDMESRIKDIDRAFKIDSSNLSTLLAQAEYFAERGRMEPAMRVLENAENYHPGSERINLARAEVYMRQGEWQKALSQADQAVKHNMYNAEAYYLKGFLFLELKDTAKAISSFQTATEQDPDYFDAFMQLGMIHAARHDPLALQYYNSALQIKPDHPDALYAKGMFQQEHEMYNEAMQTYIHATKVHPEFREAYYNLGYVHMYYLKLYRESLKYFTDAIEVDPNYYQAYYNRGYAFELMGDISNAAKDYRKALSIQPDYTLAANGLSRVTEEI